MTSGEPEDSGLSEDDEDRAGDLPPKDINPSSIQRKTDHERRKHKTPNRRSTRSCAPISKAFCRCVFYLNPGAPYLPNWHIKAIAYQLDRIRRGEITRLIINMPPRYLKSLTVYRRVHRIPVGT